MTANPRILAILQNQWFRNPGEVKALFARHPEHRNRLIRDFLFMGCLSGKRLLRFLGEELCSQIIWEEASPEIGGHAGSNFGADLEHLRAAFKKHSPEIVISFGQVAGRAVKLIEPEMEAVKFLYAPHPAARTDPAVELKRLGAELRRGLGAEISVPKNFKEAQKK